MIKTKTCSTIAPSMFCVIYRMRFLALLEMTKPTFVTPNAVRSLILFSNSEFCILNSELSSYYHRLLVKVEVEFLFHCTAFDNVHVVELMVLDADDTVAYALLE